MKLTTERKDGVLFIQIDGRIDGSNAIEFQEAIRSAVEDRDQTTIVDCTNLSYVSSAGLRAVLLIAKSLSIRNMRFGLCVLTDQVQEVFEKSGFDKIIPIHASKVEALGSLRDS